MAPVGGVGVDPKPDVLSHFSRLAQPENKILAEYIWIGGSGHDLRSKTRIIPKIINKVEDLPHWNYDGSSTGQATGSDSEVIIKPIAFFPDPFRPNAHNILVLCETFYPGGEPHDTNSRHAAVKILNACSDHNPTFAFEQEYSLFRDRTHLGWPKYGYPAPQGPYYCSVGFNHNFGREVAEAHCRACLFAGIDVSGINAEVMPGQWEFQVGPVVGVAAADQLWVARYILHRVCEMFGMTAELDPKPMEGDWNGAGCHTNFCIKDFHKEGGQGWDAIHKAIAKLEPKHHEMLQAYGEGNERRLIGRMETAKMNMFSFGVADRGASIRIPRNTAEMKRGYIEDRRPASNMDPYIVSSSIMKAICF